MTPMIYLGVLKSLHDTIEDESLRRLIVRMAEIDSDITRSAYLGDSDNRDRAPLGDDYNKLWEAVINMLYEKRRK